MLTLNKTTSRCVPKRLKSIKFLVTYFQENKKGNITLKG